MAYFYAFYLFLWIFGIFLIIFSLLGITALRAAVCAGTKKGVVDANEITLGYKGVCPRFSDGWGLSGFCRLGWQDI
jgi:hypothetical protein